MTAAPIQSRNVYALIVGIEKYQAGPDYDLNGPANDALKFANWLLQHGTEPEHIYLFLSPLEQNKGVLSEAQTKGFFPSPATHDAIANTIRSKLTSKSSRGELLYIFWGGHGIITKTDATVRRLFFADTDDDTKWNLNVNSLVEALGTSAYGTGFPQQVFFIDACANAFYQGLAQTSQGVAAGVEFATSGDAQRAEQFVLFASPEYEVATNDSKTGTGHFSQAVLETLQGQPLLPDMRMLVEHLQSDFLRKQQIPPAYWLKLQDNQIEALPPKPDPSPVNSAQVLKLKYLQNKRSTFEQQLQTVQDELDATADVTVKETYEKRLNLLFKQIEKVDQDIKKLNQGND
ncbi:caspase family protein [Leptolyngbya sp. FACHB-711]|uniref:caspase family protein n=1 Tax=Leptolyngbya sp. FACHB-711 TaxID=2692813 RepID=UPI0016862603|nr:caspase family protein [Leptolyngbya sp. FACHB-711]MBD2028224.1 caspase family protein [Leptolyngbya sp. FACHB-711]